jgi:hypothetical protein
LGVSGHSTRSLSSHSTSSHRSSKHPSKKSSLSQSIFSTVHHHHHDDEDEDNLFSYDDEFCFANVHDQERHSNNAVLVVSTETLQHEINDLSLIIESSLDQYFAASQKSFALAQARYTQGTTTTGVKVALHQYGKAHQQWVYWKGLQAQLQTTKRTLDRKLLQVQRQNLLATVGWDQNGKITQQITTLRQTVDAAKKSSPIQGQGVPKRLSQNELWNKLLASLEEFHASFSYFAE